MPQVPVLREFTGKPKNKLFISKSYEMLNFNSIEKSLILEYEEER